MRLSTPEPVRPRSRTVHGPAQTGSFEPQNLQLVPHGSGRNLYRTHCRLPCSSPVQSAKPIARARSQCLPAGLLAGVEKVSSTERLSDLSQPPTTKCRTKLASGDRKAFTQHLLKNCRAAKNHRRARNVAAEPNRRWHVQEHLFCSCRLVSNESVAGKIISNTRLGAERAPT